MALTHTYSAAQLMRGEPTTIIPLLADMKDAYGPLGPRAKPRRVHPRGRAGAAGGAGADVPAVVQHEAGQLNVLATDVEWLRQFQIDT